MRATTISLAAAPFALALLAQGLLPGSALAFDKRHYPRESVPWFDYGYTADRPAAFLPAVPRLRRRPGGPVHPVFTPVYTPPSFRFSGGYPYATPSTGYVIGTGAWR